jgi:general secretion pathway protein G
MCIQTYLSHHQKELGFTLLELLVVMVIIGLLAGFVGPKYFSQIGKSNVTVAKSQLQSFSKALDAYRLDMGHYPSTEEGLEALFSAPAANNEKWRGPYLSKKIPLDPWGNPYIYRNPGTNAEFDVISLGADGKPGGSGDNADLTN